MDGKFQHQSQSQKISHLKKLLKFKSQSAKFLNSTNQKEKPNNSVFKWAQFMNGSKKNKYNHLKHIKQTSS